jgi:hypothetical protein
MCVPLAVAAAAVSAAGSLASGVQGMMSATYESRLAKRNAAMEDGRAHDSIERGQDEARAFYRQVGQLKGQQAASMAANGVDLGFGSPLALQQDTAALAQEDAGNLYRNVNERTRGFDINAANYRAAAAAARARGRAALVNSIFEAGSSMMGGFQQQSAVRARLGLAGGAMKTAAGSPNAPWYIEPK